MNGLFVSILKFKEEHPIWSFLILFLIFSYFVPIPYSHDFIRWLTKSIWDFIGIGTTR